MRLYLDENFPPVVLVPLRSVYSDHEFRSWADEGLSATLNLDLFPELARREFDAIITRDRRQLKNPAERAALAASGLGLDGGQEPQRNRDACQHNGQSDRRPAIRHLGGTG